jgi:hypothetical protein
MLHFLPVVCKAMEKSNLEAFEECIKRGLSAVIGLAKQ